MGEDVLQIPHLALIGVKGSTGARLLSARLSVVGAGGGARRVHGEVGLYEVGHKHADAHEHGRWACGGAGERDDGGRELWVGQPHAEHGSD
jgi:hypothetical protein